MLLAEMYLLAKKHGCKDAAYAYEAHCENALRHERLTDEYFSYVAALCGPKSSRYANTSLADMAFKEVSSRIEFLEYRECQVFKEKLEEESLFDAKFLKLFAMEMLDICQRVRVWR